MELLALELSTNTRLKEAAVVSRRIVDSMMKRGY